MPKPYSYDRRQKVIQAIELDGMKKSEAVHIFQLTRNTINLWLKRRAETGDYQSKSNRPHRTASKITDWDKFAQFVKTHGDKTQAQMAQLWDANVSARTFARALQKIGFTRKKRCDPATTQVASWSDAAAGEAVKKCAPRQRPMATVNGTKLNGLRSERNSQTFHHHNECT